MNPRDAEARGLQTGDPVVISTLRGSIPMFAQVTEDIVVGAVEASGMGGGPLGPEAWREACVNDLTDLKRYDPISGFPVYKALLCEVAKGTGGRTAAVEGTGEYALEPAVELSSGPPRIYLDHNATTPLDPEVRQALIAALEGYGNPSSLYAAGKESRTVMETARRTVALLIHCTARRVIFTGGGSEANNLAIKGVMVGRDRGQDHIITTAIEHPSVLQPCRRLEQQGFRVTYLPSDRQGRVRPDDLRAALDDRTRLVSVMLANNETGVIQPVAELAALARERGVLFHTDAVQAVGKIPVDVESLGVDLLTLSAHKLHGPKGLGALFVRQGVSLDPLVSGGHQEQGLRAGTENVPGIVAFGKAAELALKHLPGAEPIREKRDRLEGGIRELLPGARINGHPLWRLPNTLNVTFPGFRGESLVLALDRQGVAVSSGSACQAGLPEPSPVLLALGLSEEEAHCALRFPWAGRRPKRISIGPLPFWGTSSTINRPWCVSFPADSRMIQPAKKEILTDDGAFARDVEEGLSRAPKSLPSRYFYDEAGSRLFQQITELPEYYLTRCEFEILRDHGRGLSALLAGGPFHLVELGAGDGRKTKVLLEHFLQGGLNFRYIPIDICEAAVSGLIGSLRRGWPRLDCQGMVAEYFEGLRRLSALNERRNLVLFLGSNIGNFTRAGMRVFLNHLREALNESDLLLIGFDLIKDIPLIEKAYNDSRGITAQFNLNLLERINRELGGNFRIDRFRFDSRFDFLSGAIESYLISDRRQQVESERLNRVFSFEAGEPSTPSVPRNFWNPR